MFWGHQPSGAAKDGRRSCSRRCSHCVPDVSQRSGRPQAASRCRPIRPRRAKPGRHHVAAAVAAAAARPRRLREVAAPEPLDAGSEQTKDGGLAPEERCPSALSRGPLDEDGVTRGCRPWPRWPRRPPPPARKGSYVSAFRLQSRRPARCFPTVAPAKLTVVGQPVGRGRAQGPAAAT